MEKARLWAVEWEQGGETLTALEPTDDELRRAAPALAACYNDSHNRVMMGHGDEPHTAADVVSEQTWQVPQVTGDPTAQVPMPSQRPCGVPVAPEQVGSWQTEPAM